MFDGLGRMPIPIISKKNLPFDFFIKKGIIEDIVCDIHLPCEDIFSQNNYYLFEEIVPPLIEDNNLNKKNPTRSELDKHELLDESGNHNDSNGDQIRPDLFSNSNFSKRLADNVRSPSLSIYPANESDNIMYLDEMFEGVTNAVINTKTSMDTLSVEKRKLTYEKDDLLKMLPLSTFSISNVEISLKFAAESVEKDQVRGDRIVINTNIQDISTANQALSEIKFTLNQKSLQSYKIDDQTVLKEI